LDRPRSFDIGATIAIAWILTAIGVSILVGPELGLRGLLWLGAHHIICLGASGHELHKAWQRRAVRMAQSAQPTISTASSEEPQDGAQGA